MSRIIRNPNRGKYVVVANALARDVSLSFKARGIMLYLLSLPDDWELNIQHLAETGGKDGMSSIRSGVAELLKAGYLEHKVIRDAANRIVRHEWIIREKANAVPEVGFPEVENPHVENRMLRITYRRNTNTSFRGQAAREEAEKAENAEPSQEPQPTIQAEKQTSQKPNRPRNAILDALVVLDGTSIEQATSPAFSAAGRALATIRQVCPDVDLAKIELAAKNYRSKWPNASISALALAKHWGALQAPAKKEPQTGGFILLPALHL